jgi:hypothetical protein
LRNLIARHLPGTAALDRFDGEPVPEAEAPIRVGNELQEHLSLHVVEPDVRDVRVLSLLLDLLQHGVHGDLGCDVDQEVGRPTLAHLWDVHEATQLGLPVAGPRCANLVIHQRFQGILVDGHSYLFQVGSLFSSRPVNW